ncbi:MAG: HNH endonuclease [Pyrinomonadaceae bacterium]
MDEPLDLKFEIDFATCGVKPKGELLLRASKVLEGYGNIRVSIGRKSEDIFEVTHRLVRLYVKCQEVIFRPRTYHVEDWLAKRITWTFMNACMQRQLPKALEYKNHIEAEAKNSELYAVALDIIGEYETYCSHVSEINKHVEGQRRIIETKRNEFLVALEKRDGLYCRACGSVEDLRIDHITPLSLGGFSVLENLQLLCSFCNGSKGNRPMEYLQERINNLRKKDVK